MRFAQLFLVVLVVGAAVAWWVTRPAPPQEAIAEGHTSDLENGALVFAAAGCASCHAAPGAEGEAQQVLAGGQAFESDFGTFYAPNISPSPAGIGGWDLAAFARAVRQGVSPEGQHYYPAFPYTAYQFMTDTDVADLFAYISSLPVSDQANLPHGVGFPFNIRRSVGGWKWLFAEDDYVLSGSLSPELERGRYLVEALAHCGECHTPRNAFGAVDRDRWLAGAPNPSGKGRIPDITPGTLEWSEADLVYYFESGLTPDYDSAGGSMVAVINNLATLPESDRAAIAAYLKAVPAVP